ncbi:S49 family peptidase [Oricola indica]|jgi:signal peptide peptidase SppA|uniref:S49 family peptidase n=1 Tax=Oricola indica TaxID=2872591 RepID=UPI001CBE3667|nr:S49 family peptidase [Oricola indica]
MNFPFARISEELFEQPLAYHPRKAEAFMRAFGPRVTGHSVTIVNGDGEAAHEAFANGRIEAGIIGDRLGRRYDRAGVRPFDMVGNVAIIPIEGTLVRKGGWVGADSGETSYQGLQVQISRAASNDDVKGVVFEVDSFGGQVNGMFETASMIQTLSKAKPTIAILTDYAYSAAYCLASQTRQIIISEDGGAGSIGAMVMHADFSGNLEQEGIKVTFIHSGKHKVDGNSFQALPEDLRERLKARVDGVRDRYAGMVGKARGGRLSKADALKTEARAFFAEESVDLGLVDAIGNPNEAFEAFAKSINGSK